MKYTCCFSASAWSEFIHPQNHLDISEIKKSWLWRRRAQASFVCRCLSSNNRSYWYFVAQHLTKFSETESRSEVDTFHYRSKNDELLRTSILTVFKHFLCFCRMKRRLFGFSTERLLCSVTVQNQMSSCEPRSNTHTQASIVHLVSLRHTQIHTSVRSIKINEQSRWYDESITAWK